MSPRDGWSDYEKLVLDKLESHDMRLQRIEDRMAIHHTTTVSALEVLKVKAGIWGAAAGTIPVFISIVFKYL